MSVILENLQKKPLPFDPAQLSEAIVECALDLEKCPYETEVSVTLVDDDIIHELNRTHREIDAATDVLSFPMVPFQSPADYAVLDAADDCFDPDSGLLLLGDIVISVDHVYDQAEAYGHSLKREFGFLVAHSVLHLLGYDHMTPAETETMEKKQEKVLQNLGITRE